MITLQQAKEHLNRVRILGIQEQRLEKAQTIDSFKVFWFSDPSELEFSEHCDGIVLHPEMLYVMTTHRLHSLV